MGFDVDGVLTDGAIVYDSAGQEIKSFHVRDGLGIRMMRMADIPVGVVTGRSSPALSHRGTGSNYERQPNNSNHLSCQGEIHTTPNNPVGSGSLFPGLNGPGQGQLIGILDVHAHGNSAGQAGDLDR